MYFETIWLHIPPDSERRETFEVLIPLELVMKRVLAFHHLPVFDIIVRPLSDEDCVAGKKFKFLKTNK